MADHLIDRRLGNAAADREPLAVAGAMAACGRDGPRARITAELIDARTGFHLWSQTYDRDLKKILALQAEIAAAVTKSLKTTLLADATTIIEIGNTSIPEAQRRIGLCSRTRVSRILEGSGGIRPCPVIVAQLGRRSAAVRPLLCLDGADRRRSC